MPWDFIILLLLLGIVLPWRSTVRMRQLLRVPATSSQQRLILYAGTIAAQWFLAGVALWRALAHGIPFSALALAFDNPAPTLAAAAALTAVMVALQIYGLRRLARLPADQQGYAGVLARKLLPQNSVESLVFVALAATAAVCEEFLYRGFLLAILNDALGAIALAALASTLLFALGHLYQGVRGIVSTFFLGLLFCALRITTGSLIACAAIHFGVDLVAGLAAPRLLSPGSNHHQDPAAGACGSTPEQKQI